MTPETDPAPEPTPGPAPGPAADDAAPAQPEPRRSPLLDCIHGAVPADGVDRAVAGHYGDPIREQRRLARSAGEASAAGEGEPAASWAVDLSHRDVLSVTGEDRASWLTTLSSQVLTGLPEGASAETAFLSVQGRIETVPHVVIGPDRIWLTVEPGQGEQLAAYLESMRFMLRVEVHRHPEAAVIGSAADPERLNLPEDARLAPPWRDPWPGVVTGGTAYGPVDGHPGAEWTWWESIVARDSLCDLPVQWAGLWAVEALRIEAWRPRWGAETDEKSLPHELDWMRTAVHLAKGCYKGQESVARVHNLGHPPRRLVFLDLDGSQHTLPEAGAQVELAGRPVGRVTSAQLHHEAGPVALAVLKRSVDPTAVLTVRGEVGGSAGTQDAPTEEWAASQTVVVPPDAGSVVGRAEGLIRGPRGGTR